MWQVGAFFRELAKIVHILLRLFIGPIGSQVRTKFSSDIWEQHIRNEGTRGLINELISRKILKELRANVNNFVKSRATYIEVVVPSISNTTAATRGAFLLMSTYGRNWLV